MSFPRYPKYKDSGVEWLGEVPQHWEVRRLKSLVEEPLKYGANESAELDDRTLPRFVRITDIDDDGGLRDETFKSLPTEVAEPYLLKEGDVLLARSGATVGKSFIYSKEWGKACFAGYLIRARLRDSHCMPTWLYYFCQTNGYWAYVVGSQIQATIQNVSAEKYANLYLPLAPRAEQTLIASFLDRETSKIDGLVGEQRRLIELLKEKRQAVISHAVTKGLNPHAPLKPSGIEWLGDVPEHWGVMRLKHVKSDDKNAFVDGPFGSNLKSEHFIDDGDAYVIESGFATQGRLDVADLKTISLDHFRTVSRSETKGGDIIIAKIGAQFGKSSILPTLDKPAVVSGNSLKLTINPQRCEVKFVHWHLTNLKQLGAIDDIVNGTAQPALSLGEMNNLPMLVPPLDEQKAIVNFLETQLQEFDTLTAEAERGIELLQERRTALISAAVTGQIDVRGLVETEAA